MVVGAIPYRTFKEHLKIVKQLQKEYGKKVSLDIQNGLIFYEYERKISNDKFNEV